jgi:NAD(P)-dependent dehydrogenase (short-subunit alcohol dehydrogenase family)
MMETMATAFASYKIRCNVIAPGLFPPKLAGGTINSLSSGATAAMDWSIVPAERTRKEEGNADRKLYLASKAGAYLNGSVLVVDSGRLGILPFDILRT